MEKYFKTKSGCYVIGCNWIEDMSVIGMELTITSNVILFDVCLLKSEFYIRYNKKRCHKAKMDKE